MPDEPEYWYVRNDKQVTGPFTLAELHSRLDRGTLTWFHEVSQDRLVWVSASTLPVSHARAATPDGGRKRRSRRSIVLAGLTVVCAGLGWTYWGGQATEPPPPAGPVQPEAAPPVVSRDIHSAESESEISSAVGFVVCGRTFESPDGTRTELPASTGTCFAISETGYLLTNRHVIDATSKYRDSEERKEEEKKIGMKIEPGIWVFFFRKPENKVVKYPATIIFQTNDLDEVDLAVLKIGTGSERLPHYFRLAARGGGDGLKAKEVYALGFPAAARLPILEQRDIRELVKPGSKIEDLFQESDFDYVTERGIVNVVRKEHGKTRPAVVWILHGAKISHGNSGGPLITKDATVVGINTLVQRVVKDDVTNFFALGVSQLKEELAERLPEIREVLAERGADGRKSEPEERSLTQPDP